MDAHVTFWHSSLPKSDQVGLRPDNTVATTSRFLDGDSRWVRSATLSINMLPAECFGLQTTGDGRTFSRRYGATRRESCLRSCRETRKSLSSCAAIRSWIGEARACTNGP